MGGFGSIEDQVRRNMEMFERTFAMFAPFARQQSGETAAAEPDKSKPGTSNTGEIDDLKRQIDEMQKRIDKIGDQDKS
jgi:polyhydroxyalkanoate synthesis regulator protein